jgi:hypothetical protein
MVIYWQMLSTESFQKPAVNSSKFAFKLTTQNAEMLPGEVANPKTSRARES